MAGKFEGFNSFVEDFNKKYGVNFSFERYEIKLNQTNHMREFFTNEKKSSAADFAYKAVAKELFREAVESMIAKKANSVDHTVFLNDFDKLMDNYREYCNQTGGQKPGKNGGWGNNVEMINDFAGKIKDIPDDKSDFIKDRYIKRSLRLRDMRADLESMEKDGKTITAEELSRAIVYKRALEKAVNGRSGWWRAIHRIQGPAERRDLEAVKKFIAKYENSPVYQTAEGFANENAVGEVKSKLEAARENIKEKELLKPRRLTDASQAEERLRNQKVYNHILKLMHNIAQGSISDDQSKKNLLTTALSEGQKIMRSMWGAFEKANTPETKENAIIKSTQDLFKISYKWVNGLKFNDEETDVHDKIVVSQRITNLMLKQYSPATSDDSYKKFLDEYIVNDEKFMDGFLRENLRISKMSDEDLKGILNSIKEDITQKKTKVSNLEKDIDPKNFETSQKHIDAPIKDAPKKSLN